MKEVCSKCGSDNIQQKTTMYLNPNDLEAELDWNSVIWEDNYWCMVCEDECPGTKEIED